MTRQRLQAASAVVVIVIVLLLAGTALAQGTRNAAAAREWLGQCFMTLPVLDSPTKVYQDSRGLEFADDVFEQTNEIRTGRKLRELKRDPHLDAVAQAHAVDMARQGYFDHSSPQGMDVFDRMEITGCTDWWTGGENLAAGYRSPEVAMKSWMDSKGHRSNVLNGQYEYMGIGVYEAPGTPYGWYWVQVFASYRGDVTTRRWLQPRGE